MHADAESIRPDFEVHASDGYVGWVEEVVLRHGIEYLHVRGGLMGDTHYFVPLEAVVRVEPGPHGRGKVHLSLSTVDLAGAAWHEPPQAEGR